MTKLCVAGADGKMGHAIIQEALAKGHEVVGAVEAANIQRWQDSKATGHS
jgi:putative NADH-flavin reductase